MYKLTWEHLSEKRALLHCYVQEWSIRTARELDASVNELFEFLREEGYVEAYTLSPNKRFCEYMAGEVILETEINNQKHWGFKWALK